MARRKDTAKKTKKETEKEVKEQFLSFSAMAKELGTTRPRLSRAIEQGTVTKDAYTTTGSDANRRYKFNPELTKEQFAKFVENKTVKQVVISQHNQTLDESDQLNTEDGEEELDNSATSFDVYRALDMKYRAKKSKLEYESMAGKFVEVKEVRNVAMKIGKSVKDAFVKLPGKVVSKIIGMDDIHAIEQLLNLEVNKTLASLDWRYVRNNELGYPNGDD